VLPRERASTRAFFDKTALAFRFIERVVLPEYQDVLQRLALDPSFRVLDLGTGTGSLARAFHDRGHPVTGYDFSESLLARARDLHPGIRFERRDITRLEDVPEGAFDVVAMGYVLHGMAPALRRRALSAARRLSARYILVIDYGRKGNWFTQLIEWVEGPHYFEFVRYPFAEALHAQGIGIMQRSRTRTGGRYWLCRA